MKGKSIKRLITLSIVSVFLFLGLVDFFKDLFVLQQQINERKVVLQKEIKETFETKIEDEIKKLTSALEAFLANSEALRLFAKRDRNGLYNLLKDYYQILTREYNLKQFQFNTPSLITFLRFHLPENMEMIFLHIER